MPQLVFATQCCAYRNYRCVVQFQRRGNTHTILSANMLPALASSMREAAVVLVAELIGLSEPGIFSLQSAILARLNRTAHTWTFTGEVARSRTLDSIASDSRFRAMELYDDRDNAADFAADAEDMTEEEEDNSIDGLYPYSHKPEPQFKRAAGEPRVPYPAYFGVELEIDSNTARERDRVPQQAGDLFYCKEDGSLGPEGIELVSHPGTEAWWREQKGGVTALLARLQRDGWKSHDIGTCGVHVHISRRAFTSTLHLYRFLHLIYRSPRLTLMISQRQPDKLTHWASLTPERRKALKRKVGIGYQDESRYEAVNMTSATAEVRIFRGTLRPDRFYKNLEYIWAALAFTSETTKVRLCSADNFLAWVQGRNLLYPNLAAFTKKEWAQLSLGAAVRAVA